MTHDSERSCMMTLLRRHYSFLCVMVLAFSGLRIAVMCFNLTSTRNVTLENYTFAEYDEWNRNLSSNSNSTAAANWTSFDDVVNDTTSTDSLSQFTDITSINMSTAETLTGFDFTAITSTKSNVSTDSSTAEISSTGSTILTIKYDNVTATVNGATSSTHNLNNLTSSSEESTAKMSENDAAAWSTSTTPSTEVTSKVSSQANGTFLNLATQSPGGFTWFVVSLEGNCSVITRGRPSQGEKSFKNLFYLEILQRLNVDDKSDLSINDMKCVSGDRIFVNFTVSTGVANLSQLLDETEALNQPLIRVHDVDIYVYEIELWDGEFLSKEPDINLKHTDVELVIYIAVGSSCAFLLTLALSLLLCKYCCHSKDISKTFETSRSNSNSAAHRMGVANANNTNLRLEDYTLTRIPRPKFGYVDYYRNKRYCPLDDKMCTSSAIGSAGMVQPYDTSVVPLEDAYSAPLPHPMRDGVIIKPSDVRRFGGSLSRIYLNDDGFSVRSNEYLSNSKMERSDGGVDNPNFQ
ncbi:hypothetical protein CHUAL_010219 [Chamberlinius hualienensis]